MTSPATRLRRFPILAELSEEEFEQLSKVVREVDLERGAYLFHEGDPGDSVFFLEEGVLVAERGIDPAAGSHKDLAILPALSPVGELALAEEMLARSASVRVEVRGRAQRLDLADFHRLASDSPALASKLFRSLFGEASRRLRATNDELVAIYEVAQLVTAGTDPVTVIETLVRTIVERLEADCGLLALYSATSNQLRIVHAFGADTGALLGTTVPLEGGLTARAYDEQRALLVERMLGAQERWEAPSMIIAPLIVGDASAGVMILGRNASVAPFRLPQMSLASAVANISARLIVDAFADG